MENADKFGISDRFAVRFRNDRPGVALNFCYPDAAISDLRSSGMISKDWKKDREDRFKKKQGVLRVSGSAPGTRKKR